MKKNGKVIRKKLIREKEIFVRWKKDVKFLGAPKKKGRNMLRIDKRRQPQ